MPRRTGKTTKLTLDDGHDGALLDSRRALETVGVDTTEELSLQVHGVERVGGLIVVRLDLSCRAVTSTVSRCAIIVSSATSTAFVRVSLCCDAVACALFWIMCATYPRGPPQDQKPYLRCALKRGWAYVPTGRRLFECVLFGGKKDQMPNSQM